MSISADAFVRARIDPRLKKRAVKALDKMGLSMSDAIRLMLVRVAEEERLPFEVRIPNAATKAAMDELDRGEGKRFQTVAELMDDLDADA